METTIWILQGILALLFMLAGTFKAISSKEKLLPNMPWVSNTPMYLVRLIGLAEVAGAVGVIVPYWSGIMPVLTPMAAVALGLTMVFAAIHHFTKKEMGGALFCLFLLAVCCIVAYYRFIPFV